MQRRSSARRATPLPLACGCAPTVAAAVTVAVLVSIVSIASIVVVDIWISTDGHMPATESVPQMTTIGCRIKERVKQARRLVLSEVAPVFTDVPRSLHIEELTWGNIQVRTPWRARWRVNSKRDKLKLHTSTQ